jgi:hypothetical protein
MVGLALRTYARYVVPLTAASVIAFAPLLWFAFHLPAPTEPEPAKELYRLAWICAATAWIPQYLLVAAAAPAVRGVAAKAPPSQLRALGRAIVGMLRALVPWAISIAAIATGVVALLVPGVVLAVMLALTGASEERGMPGPLHDSIAVVRRRFWPIAIAVVAIVAVDLALALATYLAYFEPIAPKKPFTTSSLEAGLGMLHALALALTGVSPLAACVLASLR